MKKLFILGLLAGPLIFSSCSKDHDDAPAGIEAKTYTGMNVLDLEYNDTDLAGKSVDVAPGANGNADLKFYSKVNLAQLNEAFKELPELDGPGVLPGSPVLALSLPVRADGDEWEFSTSGETEFVTYTLEGEFDGRKFDADFKNVLLKNRTFAGGAYKPLPAPGPTGVLSDSQPFHIVWETKAPIQLPGTQYGIQDLLRLIVNAPLIPVYNGTAEMSLSQVLANGLKTVGMTADGCMPVTYLQTANGAATFARAPRCMFMYVPLSDYAIRLFVNPTDVLTLVLLNNTNRDPNIPDHPFGMPTRAESGTLLQLLQGLVKTAAPMLAEGLPMACVRQGDGMQIYLSSEVLLPLLQQGLVPLLSNPAMRGIVADLVEHNTTLAPHAAAIMVLYDALPTILSQTTRLELGLNLTKAQ